MAVLESGECAEEGTWADRPSEPTGRLEQCRGPRRAAPQRYEDPQCRLGEPSHHRMNAQPGTMMPQGARPPLFPVGSVVRSSDAAWMIRALPLESNTVTSPGDRVARSLLASR